MNIGKFSVKRPVTIAMAALVLIMFGVVSFTRMSIDLMPKMDLPIMAVMTSYDGAGPEEVEQRVTKPIEASMAGISGMNSITSISSAGSSVVMVMFEYGTNLDSATNDIRDALEMAKMMVPEEAQDISILKLDINSLPIITIGVNGDRSLEDVNKIVEDTIAPRLERIEGVASVNVSGGQEQQGGQHGNGYISCAADDACGNGPEQERGIPGILHSGTETDDGQRTHHAHGQGDIALDAHNHGGGDEGEHDEGDGKGRAVKHPPGGLFIHEGDDQGHQRAPRQRDDDLHGRQVGELLGKEGRHGIIRGQVGRIHRDSSSIVLVSGASMRASIHYTAFLVKPQQFPSDFNNWHQSNHCSSDLYQSTSVARSGRVPK